MKQTLLFLFTLFYCFRLSAEETATAPMKIPLSSVYDFVDVISGKFHEESFNEIAKEELNEFYFETEYYERGVNQLGFLEVLIEDKEDRRIGRVKIQKIFIANQDSPIITYFFYEEGLTQVYNSFNYKTNYYYSDNLINKIEYYDEENKLDHIELFLRNAEMNPHDQKKNGIGSVTLHTDCQEKIASNKNESYSSLFMEAVETIVTKFNTISDQLSHYLKKYSFEESIKPEAEAFALDTFGQTYLAMSGYYVDETDAGIFGKGEFNSNVRITAINGILNLRHDCISTIAKLSDAHGGINIHYVFHPTGGWGSDMFNAALAKMSYISPQVKLLAKTWRELIQEMGGTENGGEIIHYAHSIGGTHTDLAKSLLTPEEKKMIHVITVGSASMITNTGFGSVVNYVSRRDGVGGISYILSLFQSPASNEASQVMIVGSHFEGWPLIDHLVTGETYLKVMNLLGEKFVGRHGPLIPPTGE